MNNYAYDNALFTFVVTRKHFFKDKQYQLFLFPDDLIMTDNLTRAPKYVIKMNLTTTIRWVVEGKRVVAFEFFYQNKFKNVSGNTTKLQLLKEMIGGKVFYSPVNNFYNFQMQLGTGMTGEVLRCISLENQEYYAVKKIDKQKLSQNEGGIPQMIHELQLMQSLSHSNIAKMNEVYTDPNYYYIVMEYIDGRTLNQELQSRPTGLSVADAIKIMQQLLDAICYIHEKGIMHRDINPLNIMKANQIKLIDFGLSRKVKNPLIFPTSGTPGYIAPEIINYQKVYDEKADIYSLGCVLYRMLTGEHLFARPKMSLFQANKEGIFELKKQPNHPEVNSTKMEQLFVLMQYMLETDPITRLSAKVCQTLLTEIDNNNYQIERMIKKYLIRRQLTFSTEDSFFEKAKSNDKNQDVSQKEKQSCKHFKKKQSIDNGSRKSMDEMSALTQKQKAQNMLCQPNIVVNRPPIIQKQ